MDFPRTSPRRDAATPFLRKGVNNRVQGRFFAHPLPQEGGRAAPRAQRGCAASGGCGRPV